MTPTPDLIDIFFNAYFGGAFPREWRLGQAFCNHFGLTDHDLFYERDQYRAVHLIGVRYEFRDLLSRPT